ncbi:MAG: hypothetical protein ACKOX6_19120 [Bdellovibrio sp.]
MILQDTCSDGSHSVESLSSWMQRIQPGKACKVPQQSSENGCQYDITDCLPEHVVQYQGVNSKVAGPNCWNLALVMGKILPNLRYSSPEEMAFYMRPPLCRQLKDGENRQAGDIGAIRGMAWGLPIEETHGFVYVSEKMVYSKNGTQKEAPYSLQSMDAMYDSYGVQNKKSCRKNEIPKGDMDCIQAVAYFRCDSMDDYLKKNKNISPKIKNLEHDIRSRERCLEASEFSGQTLSDSNLRDIQRVSGALAYYLEDLKKNNKINKLSEGDRFMVGGLQLRLQSIADQLSALKDNLNNSEHQKANNLPQAFDNAIHTLDTNNTKAAENNEAE